MEVLSVGAIVRAIAEYGILALGWILFLFSMLYIRMERARYQDLVIHIITYFTKIHMVKADDNDLTIFDSILSGTRRNKKTGEENRRRIDPPSHEN